jgi:hypothetical protein
VFAVPPLTGRELHRPVLIADMARRVTAMDDRAISLDAVSSCYKSGIALTTERRPHKSGIL